MLGLRPSTRDRISKNPPDAIVDVGVEGIRRELGASVHVDFRRRCGCHDRQVQGCHGYECDCDAEVWRHPPP